MINRTRVYFGLFLIIHGRHRSNPIICRHVKKYFISLGNPPYFGVVRLPTMGATVATFAFNAALSNGATRMSGANLIRGKV